MIQQKTGYGKEDLLTLVLEDSTLSGNFKEYQEYYISFPYRSSLLDSPLDACLHVLTFYMLYKDLPLLKTI